MKSLIIFIILFLGVYSKSYDFIVVGSGTSGSIVAAELAANYDVLVLDYGSDQSASPYTGPAFYGNYASYSGKQILGHYLWTTGLLGNTATISYNYLIPQVLGGASSLNGNLFLRPSAVNLAQWNSSLWTWNSTLNDWKSIETFIPGGINHGTSGPITVNVFQPDSVLSTIFSEMQVQFNQSVNNDSSSGYDLGVSIMARNLAVVNGSAFRQDTWTRFLKPKVNYPNLELVQSATVTKLLLKPNGNHHVYYQVLGEEYHAIAKKEVILSTGTFNTPRLLLLAGVGNCSYLSTLGIACYLNNENVGAVLRDTPFIVMIYLGPPPVAQSFGSIITTRFVVNSNTMEISAASIPVIPGVLQSYLFNLLHYETYDLGSVTIRDSNPTSDPLITLNFYQKNQSAIYDLVNTFKAVRNITSNIGLQEESPGQYYTPGGNALPTSATDAQIAAWLQSTISGYHHLASTCALHTVVDERLRVIGVPGLRVIDNSVIPIKVTGHTAAWAALIGKVGSRFVIEDWS